MITFNNCFVVQLFNVIMGYFFLEIEEFLCKKKNSYIIYNIILYYIILYNIIQN